MLDSAQILEFKAASENRWRKAAIKSNVWGFQIQTNTRWNPGLSEEAIRQYESALNASFHRDFKTFLLCMNGTDAPAVDVRGGSGELRYAPGFYSYPRDLDAVRARMQTANAGKSQLALILGEQGFRLPENANLIPIYSHRYVVCSPDLDESPVLSIWDFEDAIVYGDSLLEYLEREVLSDAS